MIYFDNAATTAPSGAAIEAAQAAMTAAFMNPSSGHTAGRKAAALLKKARGQVAEALGCQPEELCFTSGGTEADNLAIFSAAKQLRHRGRHLITTAVEHPAVLECFKELERQGFVLSVLEPDETGSITLNSFLAALKHDTVFASVMLVNNESGAVQPVREMAAALKAKNPQALFHTDAVQAFLKVPFTPKSLGVDLVSISAHKIHGLRGAGALYVRKGLHLSPLLYGGGQEGGLRSGTEALPAIAAFGAAAAEGKKYFHENVRKMTEIRDFLLNAIPERIENAKIVYMPQAPHVLNISLPDCRSEVILNCLDAEGICVSKSSACKRGGRSHVLEAMHVPAAVIDGAVRLSFSAENSLEEAETLVDALYRAHERVK